MGSTRWRKARRDLSHHKGRTLMVIAAFAVGVAASGSILSGYSVITREMDRNYLETNPPSATLYLDSVDADLVASVEARPEIASAEARREVRARLVAGADEWIPLQLVVVTDFDDLTIGRFYPESGEWGPARDEIVIERSSLDEYELAVGDSLTVALPSGTERSLSVSGLVHDPGRTPAWMTGQVIGYITLDGLANLGASPQFDQLLVVAADEGDRTDNRLLAENLRADLEAAGLEVGRVDVPVPGEHPAQGAMTTFLFLLLTFGVVALIASGALAATLITAQLKQQSREIGLMKAVGAQTGQIASIYLGTVALLVTIGLVIGVPLGILGGRGFVGFAFGTLNFEVESYRLDAWVIPVQVLAALIVPLAAVLPPVLKSSRVPVREVITDHGISARASGVESDRGILSRIPGLSRTATFGIRNAFRTRSRTVLTAVAVGVGGAAFMVALNTGTAWSRTVDAEFDARQYELEIDLDRAYPGELLEQALGTIPPVSATEVWNRYPAAIELATGGTGDTFRLLVPPDETEMINFPILEGRWLKPGDNNSLVVTQTITDPAPAVGSTISMIVDGTTTSWTVVGRVRQLSGGETGVAYASSSGAEFLQAGSANHIRIAVDGEQPTLGIVERSLADRGIGVVSIATAAEGRESLDDHLVIIVGLLMIMAILISIVGGLGLVETMSISVMERRREIGVMRAAGATTTKVIQVVVVEGLVIAVLSWLVAVGLSIPATVVVETVTGQMFVETPLVTSFSPLGAGLWLAIVIVLSAGASAIPALESTEAPVRQALAYE